MLRELREDVNVKYCSNLDLLKVTNSSLMFRSAKKHVVPC